MLHTGDALICLNSLLCKKQYINKDKRWATKNWASDEEFGGLRKSSNLSVATPCIDNHSRNRREQTFGKWNITEQINTHEHI